jgi:non-specific serine/threonine protein kinase/serine/threonine-protein kinase
VALEELGRLQLWQSKFAAAESTFTSCLKQYERGHATAPYRLKLMLGTALLKQDKLDEAQGLLIAGYGGLKPRLESQIPEHATRLAEALNLLIELYTKLERPYEVTKWRAELDTLTSSASSSE